MEKKNMLSIWDRADVNCKDFLNLCDKAKALIYDYISQDYKADDVLSTLELYGVLQ